jgi:MOSC domain-containing protein YiiM
VDQPLQLEIVAVNVGRVEVIGGDELDPEIRSGIRKRPVGTPSVSVGALGIVGDEQADTRRLHGVQIHGGPEKTIYAYPSEHFPWWSRELEHEIAPGAFGENLTLRGAVESETRIGDVWRWGAALLQVTEPRGPCYKLGIHRGTTRVIELMNESGRTGWYMRVLVPGEAPADGGLALVERHSAGVTVAQASAAWLRRDAGELRVLQALEPLGADMRQSIRNALRRGATT